MTQEKMLEILTGLRDGMVTPDNLNQYIDELKFSLLHARVTGITSKRALKTLIDLSMTNDKDEWKGSLFLEQAWVDGEQKDIFTFTDNHMLVSLFKNPFARSDLLNPVHKEVFGSLIKHHQVGKRKIKVTYSEVCNRLKIAKAHYKGLGNKRMNEFLPVLFVGDYAINITHLKVAMEALQTEELEVLINEDMVDGSVKPENLKKPWFARTRKGIVMGMPVRVFNSTIRKKDNWEYEE